MRFAQIRGEVILRRRRYQVICRVCQDGEKAQSCLRCGGKVLLEPVWNDLESSKAMIV